MSDTKWTKGPWKLRGLSDHVRVERINTEDPFHTTSTNIARCGSSKPGPREPESKEVWANARLISKAPEMAELLRQIVAYLTLIKPQGGIGSEGATAYEIRTEAERLLADLEAV